DRSTASVVRRGRWPQCSVAGKARRGSTEGAPTVLSGASGTTPAIDVDPTRDLRHRSSSFLEVPHLDGVVPAPREQALAVARECQAGHLSHMAAQGAGFLAR